LRVLNSDEIQNFFASKRFETDLIKKRGPALPLESIAKDNRLKDALLQAYDIRKAAGHPSVTIRELLEGNLPSGYAERQQEFLFSATDVLDESVNSEQDLEIKYGRVAERFLTARRAALRNTEYYLSMVNDLDVYVATSMRSRQDFRKMANDCDKIFSDNRLKSLHLRYFDPTLSAAGSHEDKEIIECLMVKCAKVLVYCAGDRESYGKDAEAAWL
jgi:hypothetical protein